MDHQIKYRSFVEAARTGSITAAANSLNYSQPGISRMIHALEAEWGFPLLERKKEGVTLTDEGAKVYELCMALLENQNLLDQTVKEINGAVVGSVRVGSYFSVLMNWIPDIMETLHELHPYLEFQVTEANASEQIALLKNSEIDIGILSSSAPEEFTFIPLYKDPIVVVMAEDHPLTKLDTLTPADIAEYPFLIKPEHSLGVLRDILLSQSAQTKSSYYTRSDVALLALANKGLGIGAVGEMVAHSGIPTEYRHFSSEYYRLIGIAVPNWKPVTPAVRELIRVVCEKYQSAEFKTP